MVEITISCHMAVTTAEIYDKIWKVMQNMRKRTQQNCGPSYDHQNMQGTFSEATLLLPYSMVCSMTVRLVSETFQCPGIQALRI